MIRLLLIAITFLTSISTASAEPILYATGIDVSSKLFTIDTSTGAATTVGPNGPGANLYAGGLAYNAFTDTMYATGFDTATSNSALYTVDPTTGAATRVGFTNGGVRLDSGGLAYDLTDRLLYATGTRGVQGTSLFAVSQSTGAVTLVGDNSAPFGTGTSPVNLYGLGYDSLTDTLYANGSFLFDPEQKSALWTVDQSNGRATFIGFHGVTAGRQLNYSGLAFHPTTHTLYSLGSLTGSQGGLYTVNPATGAATWVGPNRIGVDGGLVFLGNPVPEPSTLSLFLLGISGLIIYGWRRHAIR